MYPHERSLVERLADEPFALIGVNSDKDREKLKGVIEKKNLNWRSFWNGGGTDGPISRAWKVGSWPTLLVIDAKGVIRFKGVKRAAIDRAIESASDRIELWTRRFFIPRTETRLYRWPGREQGPGPKLWLDQDLISITAS